MRTLNSIYSLVLLACLAGCTFTEPKTGAELMERSIRYHDPSGNWTSFQATFSITTQYPDKSECIRWVEIHNSQSRFAIKERFDGLTIYKGIINDSCFRTINESPEVTEAHIQQYQLSCDQISHTRNFFLYLYGLPMKLKDSGTLVRETIKDTIFSERKYKMLTVTYTPEVGSDTWRFLFDPETYALRGYKFQHTEVKNDGEYVTLAGEEVIQGIRIPKIRKWYRNATNELLATDILSAMPAGSKENF